MSRAVPASHEANDTGDIDFQRILALIIAFISVGHFRGVVIENRIAKYPARQ